MGFSYGTIGAIPVPGSTGNPVGTTIDGHVVLLPDGGWTIHAANIVVSIPGWSGSLSTTLDSMHYGPPPFGSWQYYGFHSTLSEDLDPSTAYTVRVDYSVIVDSPPGWGPFAYTGNWSFTTGSALSKPTTPIPANASGPGISFTTRTLSWANGGGATGYRVRIGPYPIAQNAVSALQIGTSYVIPETDIVLYKDNPIAWRVDATDGSTWVDGDTWTFDPRPAKAATPAPSTGATGQHLGLSALSWATATGADEYNVYPSWYGGVGGLAVVTPTLSLPQPFMDPLHYATTYTWRVDTDNVWGTTTGDNWTFRAMSLKSVYNSWKNYPGKTLGPGEINGSGVEGPGGDYFFTGENFMSTTTRLLAFARDRVWYVEL